MHRSIDGVGSDDRDRADRLGIEGQDGRSVDRLVAQQDGAPDGGASGEGTLGRVVDRLLGVVGGAFVGLRPVDEQEEIADQPVDLRLGDITSLDGGGQLLAVDANRSGHLQAQAGIGCARSVVHSVPVRHDETVETPLVAQDVGQEASVVGAELAVEAVVGAHHPPRPGLLDGALEGTQVQLAQSAFVDVDVDAHPLDLGVVGDEVLDRDGDVVRLHATDVRDGERAGELGVLAVALERAPADRGSMEVDGGTEDDVGRLAA